MLHWIQFGQLTGLDLDLGKLKFTGWRMVATELNILYVVIDISIDCLW